MDFPSSPTPNWHAWVVTHSARFLLFARSQTRCEADAHDLLQETLVEVWRREQHRPPDDALVFKTLRRRAIAYPEWWHSPADAAASDAEADADLARAVQLLPAHLREVVLLKVWGGQTFRQIADALDIPRGTAASRYRYALNHLRDQLKPAHP